ncbi:MAG: DUF2752 domain-containing protein [Bacteroidia bacterium]
MIAAIFAAIIIYCLLYPLLGNFVVKCAVEEATGHTCIGCGLTRGIHQALLLHFDKALQWNNSSLLILSFLIITILLRIVTSVVISINNYEKHIKFILYADLIFSLLLYLYCFRHFFTNQILK